MYYFFHSNKYITLDQLYYISYVSFCIPIFKCLKKYINHLCYSLSGETKIKAIEQNALFKACCQWAVTCSQKIEL